MSSELATVAAVLRSIGEVVEQGGAFYRRAVDIRVQRTWDGPSDPELRTQVFSFSGMPPTGGAGAAAYLTTRLPDGRGVSWMVEVVMDEVEPGGEWSAIVKGDVDRDLPVEEFPDDECLFLEQRTVHEVDDIPSAVREMAELVVVQDVLG